MGFHTDFDRAVLRVAFAGAGLPADDRPWLDLAPLAGALVPEAYRYGGRSLDDWLAAFGIECTIRHNAASDALATAELLLRLRAIAAKQGTRRLRRARQGRARSRNGWATPTEPRSWHAAAARPRNRQTARIEGPWKRCAASSTWSFARRRSGTLIAEEKTSVDALLRRYILPLALLAPIATVIGMKTFDRDWDPVHGYLVPAEQILRGRRRDVFRDRRLDLRPRRHLRPDRADVRRHARLSRRAQGRDLRRDSRDARRRDAARCR